MFWGGGSASGRRLRASWQPSAAGAFVSRKWSLSERFVKGGSVLPICTSDPKWLRVSSPREFSESRLCRPLVHYWRTVMSVTAGETLCCIHDDILESAVNLVKLVMFCSEKMATVTAEFPKVQSSSNSKENQLIWQSVAFSFDKTI